MPSVAESLVKDWNEKYPIGTKVLLTNDLEREEETATRSVAWVLPSGSPVVMVEGRAGGYLLTRIKAKPTGGNMNYKSELQIEKETIERGIELGRNQVLYLLLAIGDENVAHDNFHPDKAEFLLDVRRKIVSRLKGTIYWPKEWPDFEEYTYTPG